MANKIKYLKKDGTEINKLEVANLLATLSDVSTDAKYIGKFFTALDANNIRDAFNTLIDDLVSKGLMVDNGDGTFTPVDMNAIEVAINKKIQITSGDSTNTTRSEMKLLLKDDEAGLVHEATFANILTILGLTQAEFDNIKLDHTVYATIQKLSEQKAAITQETDTKLASKSSITLDNVTPANMKKAMAKAGLDVNVFKHELVEYFAKPMPDPKYTTRPDGSALETGDWFIDDSGQSHIFAHTWHEQQVGIDLTPYALRAESDAKYEPRNYDFSNSETPLTYNLTNAKRFQIISKPSGADNTPIGLTNKIVINVATTDPSELPQDSDQITYGSDLLWVVMSNGDIVTWGEIKDNVNDKKIMVIKHLSNGNWELVRWEVSNDKKYASIDLTTANVGAANAGKIFQVKPDGTIEYVAKPKEYEIKQHFGNRTNKTAGNILTVPADEEIISIEVTAMKKTFLDSYSITVERIDINNWNLKISDNNNDFTIPLKRTGNSFNTTKNSAAITSVSVHVFTRKEI